MRCVARRHLKLVRVAVGGASLLIIDLCTVSHAVMTTVLLLLLLLLLP